MATEEWKKEVQKHEKYIKDLEDKFKLKCEEMQVVNCDYIKKNIKFYFNPLRLLKCLDVQLRC